MPNKLYSFDVFKQTQLRRKDGFSKNTAEACGVLSHNTNLLSITYG